MLINSKQQSGGYNMDTLRKFIFWVMIIKWVIKKSV